MIRLAAIGCGRVLERFYLPALRTSPDWRLVAAIDPRPERRRWAHGWAGDATVCSGLSELVHLEVDAALVATPPDTHAAIGAEALQRGAHLLVEKPLALRRSEAESLLRLAGVAGRQVWVGFNRRFRPSYLALRERLRRLAVERIVSVRYDLISDVRDWGAVSNYLGDGNQGGGVLDDIGSHQLDLVPWLVGQRPHAVSATHEPADQVAAVSITLRFAGGLEARCRAGHGAGAMERLEVQLDRGTLLATRGGLTKSGMLPTTLARRLADLRDTSLGAAHRLLGRPALTARTFQRQLAEWARALRGEPSHTAADGGAGARCVSLVEACRESLARDGAWVTPRD